MDKIFATFDKLRGLDPNPAAIAALISKRRATGAAMAATALLALTAATVRSPTLCMASQWARARVCAFDKATAKTGVLVIVVMVIPFKRLKMETTKYYHNSWPTAIFYIQNSSINKLFDNFLAIKIL
jgi:hypothetical protein